HPGLGREDASWLIKLIRRVRPEARLEYITPEDMRELERRASEYGLGVKQLMENAGRGVAEFVVSRYGSARRVCVVCGAGNNGGDGFVAARYLSASRQVEVILLTSPERIRTGEARQNWEALASTRAEVHVAGETSALTGLSAAIADADVIVVAIFGTGVKGGALGEPYATAIALVNGSKAVRVAVDLPSGIDPSTGAASRPTVVADVTLALHLPKVGLRGREEYTGEVVVVPIGIRSEGA
ncbi:MAG: NAD(P)H-hydrate epimerase, partial [Nitrososphaerales archaeon]